jgi:hypothetical protein
MPLAGYTVGMNDALQRMAEERDEDLARWARELGVTYEELLSTIDYAGPTFKDLTLSSDERLAGSTSMPS